MVFCGINVLICSELPYLPVLPIKISGEILGISCNVYNEADNSSFAWTYAVLQEALFLSSYRMVFSTMKK